MIKISFKCSIDDAKTPEFQEVISKINLLDRSTKEIKSIKENEPTKEIKLMTENELTNGNELITENEYIQKEFDIINTKYGKYLVFKLSNLSSDEYIAKKNSLIKECKNISNLLFNRGLIFDNIPTNNSDLTTCYIKYIEHLKFIKTLAKVDTSINYNISWVNDFVRVGNYDLHWLKKFNFKIISVDQINILEAKIYKLMITKSIHFKGALGLFYYDFLKYILPDLKDDKIINYLEFAIISLMEDGNIEIIINYLESVLLYNDPPTVYDKNLITKIIKECVTILY